MGDLLLEEVARRLSSCVRECDTVARLGGDEFMVMLEQLSHRSEDAAVQTEIVAKKIIAHLDEDYLLGVHDYRCTPSVGATLFLGNEQQVDELIKQADIAMYQSKKGGRNQLSFFDPSMQQSVIKRATLDAELHRALERQEFRLHYQIQVDAWRQPIGAEALIRWYHPELGIVSPVEFIPLAEETGLILPIGQWVLKMACLQIQAWQDNPKTCDLVLAVNISAKQIRQKNFSNMVLTLLEKYQVPPHLLKLEITESVLLEDVEDTIKTMLGLNSVGIRFSMDDFGAGYSSLQYLKRLPLEQLKIDRSFVQDLENNSSDRTIVRTIITMAQSLNIDVIAEGVENEAQRELLQNKGCIHYQGYLFGKPVDIEQFNRFLE
jgi:predicted signal transduction protein with EAL and GGDEF domain